MATRVRMYKPKWNGAWQISQGAEALQGKLRTKNKQHILDLYTTKNFEGQYLGGDAFGIKHANYPIIFSEDEHHLHNGCTLYNCKWLGTRKVGENLWRVRYVAAYVFENAIIECYEKMLVHSARFSFSDLANWCDGWQSIRRLPLTSKGDLYGPEEKDDWYREERRIDINDEMAFVFIDQYQRHDIEIGVSYQKQFKKYLKIEFKRPVHFKELMTAAFSFGRLLEVAMLRRVPFKIFQVEFHESAYRFLDELLPFQQNRTSSAHSYQTRKGGKVENDGLHQNYMLFSGWGFSKENLDDIIRQWFANRPLHYLYDYFIDSNYWAVGRTRFMTNVMFNNRFLSLLHGLEGFHTAFYGTPKADTRLFEQQRARLMRELERSNTESKLKQWINNNLKTPKLQYDTLEDKLSHLIDEFNDQLQKRLGDVPTFKNFLLRSVKYRNRLSHGAIEETHQGDEFRALYHGLQILVILCILKSLKIETHHNIIESNQKIADKAYEVLHYIKQNTGSR